MSQAVHDMFQSIAKRYDLANDVLSFGVHRIWRHALIDFARISRGDAVLDLCTGTGKVARDAAHASGATGRVVGLDFVMPMLEIAEAETSEPNGTTAPIQYLRADAGCLPFADGSFDVITMAYGIRNVDNASESLREIHRVLKSKGQITILEFGQPAIPVFSQLYTLYSQKVMPAIGGLVTGDRAAYEYLPRTSAAFPCGKKFLELLADAQFQQTESRALFGGVAFLYRGLAAK